jgi:hypothetical protein
LPQTRSCRQGGVTWSERFGRHIAGRNTVRILCSIPKSRQHADFECCSGQLKLLFYRRFDTADVRAIICNNNPDTGCRPKSSTGLCQEAQTALPQSPISRPKPHPHCVYAPPVTHLAELLNMNEKNIREAVTVVKPLALQV